MDSTAEITTIQPNIPKLSEALKILSDELPRLSNLESSAILHTLQGVQDEIRHSNGAQNDLRTLLDGRLSEIQDSLTSFESRIKILEHLSASFLHAQEDMNSDTRTSIKAEDQEVAQPVVVDTPPSSRSKFPVTPSTRFDPSKSGAPASMGILEGGSGALLIIIASMIPILAILFYAQ